MHLHVLLIITTIVISSQITTIHEYINGCMMMGSLTVIDTADDAESKLLIDAAVVGLMSRLLCHSPAIIFVKMKRRHH